MENGAACNCLHRPRLQKSSKIFKRHGIEYDAHISAHRSSVLMGYHAKNRLANKLLSSMSMAKHAAFGNKVRREILYHQE